MHVVDASDEASADNIQAVHEVLADIEANEVPELIVMNKIDCLPDVSPRIERDSEGVPRRVWLSAKEGKGIELLLQALTERISSQMVEHEMCVPPTMSSKLRSAFFSTRSILSESYDTEGNWLVRIRMQQADWSKLAKKEGNIIDDFIVPRGVN